jgi:hypothetical protein
MRETEVCGVVMCCGHGHGHGHRGRRRRGRRGSMNIHNPTILILMIIIFELEYMLFPSNYCLATFAYSIFVIILHDLKMILSAEPPWKKLPITPHSLSFQKGLKFQKYFDVTLFIMH